ncbi:MAG: CAP domain-containing protein [Rhodoferax sp.]|nr:CAP domain-containing protein [Rhodoferax sp.]
MIKKWLPIILGVLLCAGADLRAQTDSVTRVVNRLRAPGGGCVASAQPLVAQAALNSAGSLLAQGSSLEASLKSAGYRATQAQVITVSGPGLRAGLEVLLAKRFCAQIGKKELSDIGVFEARNQIWIVLAAPFAPKLELTRQQVAERMLALVNQARALPRRCGDKSFAAVPALAWDTTLERVAAQHATDMATHDYFSHTARDGSTPAQRVTRAGYHWRITGENIAAGQLSPEAAVAGWIKSPGHCENLMNAAYTEMGVAAAVNSASKMGLYWAQEFGTPR